MSWKFQNIDKSSGNELVQAIISLTGLPEDLALRELESIVMKSGHRVEDLTLDQLRSALLAHLETLHPEFSRNIM